MKPCCGSTVGPEVMRLTFGARALTLDQPFVIIGNGFIDLGNGTPIPFTGTYAITSVVGTTAIIYSTMAIEIGYFGEMLVSIQLVPGTTYSRLTLFCNPPTKGQLTSLDLTGVVAENFNFDNHTISSIVFDSVTYSPGWFFGNNNLSALDLSTKTTALVITVDNNPFSPSGLTLPTPNTNLERVSVAYCNLSTLVPAVYPSLTRLYCAGNSISTLDLSSNVLLEYLDCSGNPLSSFSVASNTALNVLNCSNLQLTTLDLSANTSLEELTCAYNQLTTLDISLLGSLIYLDCTGNPLSLFSVASNTGLQTLNCSNIQLTTLDLSANPSLIQLTCAYNQLTTLDISLLGSLVYLDCTSNQLKNLDVSANMELQSIKCTDNDLSGNLYLSSNVLLISLDCSGNYLTDLNVSGCVDLTSAICSANRFSQGAANAIVSALVINAALGGTLDFTGNTPTITNPGTGDWDILETTNGWTIIV